VKWEKLYLYFKKLLSPQIFIDYVQQIKQIMSSVQSDSSLQLISTFKSNEELKTRINHIKESLSVH